MPSWMDIVLEDPSPSPRPTSSTVPSSTAGTTISESTAPAPTGLVPLAAPQSAPGNPWHGAPLNKAKSIICLPPSHATPQLGRAAMSLEGRCERKVQVVADKVEAFAVELQESRARNEELQASLNRRHELQMVIMQGLVDHAMDERCRGKTKDCDLEPELRLAALLGGEYLARAQELINRPTTSSGKKPLLQETLGASCAAGQSSQSSSLAEVAGWMPASRTDGSRASPGASSSPSTRPEEKQNARTMLQNTKGECSAAQHERIVGSSRAASWTPINSRTSVHDDRIEASGPEDISMADDEEGRSMSDIDLTPTTSSPSDSHHDRGIPKPRYSVPRQTRHRQARGPPGQPFIYTRMPRTVIGIWNQWKYGTEGNRPIETLEQDYGTAWRTGDNREIKYGSNYVGTRHRIVQYIEMRAQREGEEPEELCRRLDEHVDRRIQQLLGAIKKDQDPFVVMPRR